MGDTKPTSQAPGVAPCADATIASILVVSFIHFSVLKILRGFIWSFHPWPSYPTPLLVLAEVADLRIRRQRHLQPLPEPRLPCPQCPRYDSLVTTDSCLHAWDMETTICVQCMSIRRTTAMHGCVQCICHGWDAMLSICHGWSIRHGWSNAGTAPPRSRPLRQGERQEGQAPLMMKLGMRAAACCQRE
jgi:hypothetical protein